jgi:hypothetical protein
MFFNRIKYFKFSVLLCVLFTGCLNAGRREELIDLQGVLQVYLEEFQGIVQQPSEEGLGQSAAESVHRMDEGTSSVWEKGVYRPLLKNLAIPGIQPGDEWVLLTELRTQADQLVLQYREGFDCEGVDDLFRCIQRHLEETGSSSHEIFSQMLHVLTFLINQADEEIVKAHFLSGVIDAYSEQQFDEEKKTFTWVATRCSKGIQNRLFLAICGLAIDVIGEKLDTELPNLVGTAAALDTWYDADVAASLNYNMDDIDVAANTGAQAASAINQQSQDDEARARELQAQFDEEYAKGLQEEADHASAQDLSKE